MASVWLSTAVEGSKSVVLLQTMQLSKYLCKLYIVLSNVLRPICSPVGTVSLWIILEGHSRVVPSWWCNLDAHSFLWLISMVALVKVMCMVPPTLPQSVPLCPRACFHLASCLYPIGDEELQIDGRVELLLGKLITSVIVLGGLGTSKHHRTPKAPP